MIAAVRSPVAATAGRHGWGRAAGRPSAGACARPGVSTTRSWTHGETRTDAERPHRPVTTARQQLLPLSHGRRCALLTRPSCATAGVRRAAPLRPGRRRPVRHRPPSLRRWPSFPSPKHLQPRTLRATEAYGPWAPLLRRLRHAPGRSGVLPRRSGARSAAAGFPGAEGIALARPRAAPEASSEWTGFLWHPPGPGRRGSAPRPPHRPHSPTGRRPTTFSPPPRSKGLPEAPCSVTRASCPAGVAVLARMPGAKALAWAGFRNPTVAEACGVRSRRLLRSPKFG